MGRRFLRGGGRRRSAPAENAEGGLGFGRKPEVLDQRLHPRLAYRWRATALRCITESSAVACGCAAISASCSRLPRPWPCAVGCTCSSANSNASLNQYARSAGVSGSEICSRHHRPGWLE